MHGNQVARRQRIIASLHHNIGEELVQRLCFLTLRIGGGLAGEDATQHPTRTVDAYDAGKHLAPTLDGDRQCQFGAEHTFDFFRVLVGFNQVGANVIPQSERLRGRERFNLHAGGTVGDSGAKNLLSGTVGFHAQFNALQERQII